MTKGVRPCPLCRESVAVDAVRCKHCWGNIPPPITHDGVCPLCREAIDAAASRCKHCKSDLAGNRSSGCGCSETTAVDDTTLSLSAALESEDIRPFLTTAKAQCGPCRADQHIITGWFGSLSSSRARQCTISVPFSRPDGSVFYKTVTWWERCGSIRPGVVME